ncbi:hypothetical protein BSLG_008415 [Batrachochytrium salamandrivorans]|nr:hypothetical protein BSLG_008415 [Batrachochytrium salamandrivorans]
MPFPLTPSHPPACTESQHGQSLIVPSDHVQEPIYPQQWRPLFSDGRPYPYASTPPFKPQPFSPSAKSIHHGSPTPMSLSISDLVSSHDHGAYSETAMVHKIKEEPNVWKGNETLPPLAAILQSHSHRSFPSDSSLSQMSARRV